MIKCIRTASRNLSILHGKTNPQALIIILLHPVADRAKVSYSGTLLENL